MYLNNKDTEKNFVVHEKHNNLSTTHSLFRAALLLANYKDFLSWIESACNKRWRGEEIEKR